MKGKDQAHLARVLAEVILEQLSTPTPVFLALNAKDRDGDPREGAPC